MSFLAMAIAISLRWKNRDSRTGREEKTKEWREIDRDRDRERETERKTERQREKERDRER